MRAVTINGAGGPEVLQITELPVPEIGPDQVLIHTVASGVNRADLLQRRGLYSAPPGESEIIGLECSGVIADVGSDVTGWKIGDACVALLAGGGYAEYVAVAAGQVLAPPVGLDLVTSGALLEVSATVVSNLDHVGLKPGDRFLVHGGAGGIGSIAIQYAKVLGATVVTTAGTAAKRALCRDLGADLALDYHEDWVEALTSELGAVDIILDIIGAKYLEANIKALANDGRLCVIGLQGGTKATLNLQALLNKRATVTATSLRFRPARQKAAICTRVGETIWPLLTDGSIQSPPLTRVRLDDVAQAHRLLESGATAGKIVLVHPFAEAGESRPSAGRNVVHP